MSHNLYYATQYGYIGNVLINPLLYLSPFLSFNSLLTKKPWGGGSVDRGGSHLT
jgi:hypothetical protein